MQHIVANLQHPPARGYCGAVAGAGGQGLEIPCNSCYRTGS